MRCLIAVVLCLMFVCCVNQGNTTHLFDLPDMQTVSLSPIAHIKNKEIGEGSGLVKSRAYPGLYWTHNDSGGKARLYAIRFNANKSASIVSRLDLKGVKNRDWEDISIAANGDLYVSDTGNNRQQYEYLNFYVISERSKSKTPKKYLFRYPDYEKPVKERNFDCEAMFHYKQKLYLLSKHRDNDKTKLYRFNKLTEEEVMEPEKLYTFDIGGMVTGADVSKNEQQLAVLTYDSVWLFKNFKEDDFFTGDVYFLPISARQCEAICFDNENELIITNEQREIFRIATQDFIKIEKHKNF